MTTRFKKKRKKKRPCERQAWLHQQALEAPGGRGNAEGMHHHHILFDKYHQGYIGKVGMRYFHRLRNKFHSPAINVDRLRSLIPEVIKDAAIASDGSSAPLIDVPQFKYFEVLDKGILPQDRPVVVKANLVSKIAKKKIKAAGGAVMLTA